jgi:hypothetical protein
MVKITLRKRWNRIETFLQKNQSSLEIYTQKTDIGKKRIVNEIIEHKRKKEKEKEESVQ